MTYKFSSKISTKYEKLNIYANYKYKYFNIVSTKKNKPPGTQKKKFKSKKKIFFLNMKIALTFIVFMVESLAVYQFISRV